MSAKTKADWLKLYFILMETVVLIGCFLVFVDVFFVGEVRTRGSPEQLHRTALVEVYRSYGLVFMTAYLMMLVSIPIFSRCRPALAPWARKTVVVATVCFLLWLMVLPGLH